MQPSIADCLLFFLLTGIAQCQPVFPAGVSPVLDSIAGRQPPAPDDAAGVAKLIESGSRSLKADLVDEFLVTDFKKAAYAKTHLRVLQHKFVGGCPRNMNGCPRGWTAAGSTCTPPEDYDGLCGPINFSEYPADEKEALAWKCRASFPCSQGVSARSRSCVCPQGWVHEGNSLCIAPRNYNGLCSPVADFDGYSSAQKAWWSKRCSASWSCAAGEHTASSDIFEGLAAELSEDYPGQPGVALDKVLKDALAASAESEDLSLDDLMPLGAAVPDYTAQCPEGWILDLVHDCFAPSSYEGPCVRRKAFNKYNVAEKAEWAKICGVTWPNSIGTEHATGSALASAGATCSADYSRDCPEHWIPVVGYCNAPAHYAGDCGYILKLANYTNHQKKMIAEKCNAPWACV